MIHVSLQPEQYPDYSTITSIRNSGFTFLQSESIQEAADIALTAHALAVKSGKGVIHFFDASSSADDDEVTSEGIEAISRILNLDAARAFHSGKIGGSSIYVDDGRLATVTETPASSLNASTIDIATPIKILADEAPISKASSVSTKSRASSVTSGPSEVSTATTVDAVARQVSSEDVYKFTSAIWEQLKEVTGRKYTAFQYTGPSDAETAIFIFGSDVSLFAEAVDEAKFDGVYKNTGIVTARLHRPWLGAKLVEVLPKTVKKLAVLEQIRRRTTKWGPVFLDILTTLQGSESGVETIVGHQLGHITADTVNQALKGIFQNLTSESPVQNLEVGSTQGPVGKEEKLEQPQVESAYGKMLNQVFGEKLHVANALGSDNAQVRETIATNLEFGFGSLLARREHRQRFVAEASQASQSKEFASETPKSLLSRWALNASDDNIANEVAPEIVSSLKADASALANKLLENKALFRKESSWLIGSDAWAYDLGNSGVHHVLASGENVNMLIIDSTPYSERGPPDAARRKKDIGLYAMNFGNAYVASVAVYSSYTQVLQAMIEADKFEGPSVVLAYLPYHNENDSPLTVLQETKKAVDLGYWPLYRWDPTAEARDEENFSLDSERIKNELKEFLARDNQLTQLMRRRPEYAASLAEDYGSEVRAAQKRKAKDAYNELLEGLFGAPLTILFTSDNGNGSSLAKRLARRGKARGLKTIVMSIEEYPIEDLSTEENIVFITSTAGQGEFPQDGHAFWNIVKDSTDLDLAAINFSVFGLGDSHYWPRKEDKVYYNKPAKDLFRVLTTLGGKALAECGLGDDQDPDGFQTGYAPWEDAIWKALGVDQVEGLEPEPAPRTNEDIKTESNFLRGTIEEGLADTTTGAISADDQQLTKFHGTYMQDDRDVREERKAAGLEPAYSFMIRCRLAGGVATPKQWVQMDQLSSDFGNETLKLTTRQTFQFHGVIKGKLKGAMRGINKALMTTIAACGDVNRNVMCSSSPSLSAYHAQVQECAARIDHHLLPQAANQSYHEIWLKDENDKKTLVAGNAVQEFAPEEPLYGPTYLPRKFKITIAIPPHNDTDVYAHDIGLIAIQGADGNLAGFNLLAGGGMGVTHNNKKTYPRTGSDMGFVSVENVHIACEKVMLVQRDFGNRKSRKNARLKYTIDAMGVDVFRTKVEEYWGKKFLPQKPFHFKSNVDTFGWQKDEKGLNHFTFFIENGRIEDTADFKMRTGLREIAKVHKGEFRLTGNQHLIISNVADEDLESIKKLMAEYKLDNTNFSGLRLSSSACVAFPTCGLAMAESERYLPVLITKVEEFLEENGLRSDSIVMRMTGCPNGCARPWLAEVAFVGKAFNTYNMYLGGGYHGQRLNKLYRASIQEEEILEIMKDLIERYAKERNTDGEEPERFGDFLVRAGVIKATTEGKTFHDDVDEEESGEE